MNLTHGFARFLVFFRGAIRRVLFFFENAFIFTVHKLDKIFASLYFIGLRERLSKIYTAFSQMKLITLFFAAWCFYFHFSGFLRFFRRFLLLARFLARFLLGAAKGGNPPSRANCERSIQGVTSHAC